MSDVGSTFGRQTRAYAEYRIFSSLARFSDAVQKADVLLMYAKPTRGPRTVCMVDVTVGDGGRVHVRAGGRHVYDAINRAAQRIDDALRRHTEIALSP